MERLVMHVDMDAFFASIEQRDHEEYREKPLIVGGLSGRGVVSTCSYEARRFGVHSAMPIVRARRLCPQGIFVEGDYANYKAVSQRFLPSLRAMRLSSSRCPSTRPSSTSRAWSS